MQVTPYAKVNNGILFIVTPNKMYKVGTRFIKTVVVENGLVHIHSTSGITTLDESYYPLITDALTNAPSITRYITTDSEITFYSRAL